MTKPIAESGKEQKQLPKADLELVSKIAKGDTQAWERFVLGYSSWVLYRARKWCERHCGKPCANCGLALLHSKMEGRTTERREDECDDGMEIYIWIFEQLQKRVVRYSARNNSKLSTFVWRILNSREFYIDWLRWKYGRVF